MGSAAQRLAALHRLAEDAGATDAEKENAKRRIAEHEAKYGKRPQQHSSSAPGPRPAREDLADFLRSMGINPDNWEQPFGESPFHYNARYRTEPVREAPPGGGQQFVWEFSRWCVNREAGPFGRVEEVKTSYNQEARATTFTWRCPNCGRATTMNIPDDMMQYAAIEKEAKRKVEEQLFTRLNGNSDNRCSRCCRHRGIG